MLSTEDFNKLTIGSIVKKPGYNIPWYRVTEIRPPSTDFGWSKGRRSVMLTNFERSPADIARSPFDMTLWEAIHPLHDTPSTMFIVPPCGHCDAAVACVELWDYETGKEPVCANCLHMADINNWLDGPEVETPTYGGRYTMTTKEAANVLSVSVGRVKHLIANGTLAATSKPRVGIGGNEWHIDSATVDAYAASERKPGRRRKTPTIPADLQAYLDMEEGWYEIEDAGSTKEIEVYMHPVKGLSIFAGDVCMGAVGDSQLAGQDDDTDCHISVQCSGYDFKYLRPL